MQLKIANLEIDPTKGDNKERGGLGFRTNPPTS